MLCDRGERTSFSEEIAFVTYLFGLVEGQGGVQANPSIPNDLSELESSLDEITQRASRGTLTNKKVGCLLE